ncbi:hypothetical protein CARUB_v10014870mg [Capsella rubella]|uniref:Non-specific lipid-transfer protein n=1 Tax=Capsella rubella TaxID=81985 RepID=R0G7Q5_9BRAS|nr:non-specific lipid-transfer protein 7 [Capsella rubella]EOA31667.1 hypothetical protein CARUB_v10014870mg [Capsella rubella]
MKLACLVFTGMIVASPLIANAALHCTAVDRNLKPCTRYLTQGNPITSECCKGVRNLNSMALTTLDRRQACLCIQSAGKAVGPGLNAGRAAGIPKTCGVKIHYNIQIRTSTNCNTVT